MDVKTALIEYGLDDKEVAVYLFLLQNCTNSAHSIAQGTGILRQTTYDTLAKLENLGLITEIIKNDKKYFIAEDPDSFIGILRDKEALVNNVMGELKNLKDSSLGKTFTRQFNGIKGIKIMYSDFLKSQASIKTIQPEIPEKFLKEYFVENFSIKRIEQRVPIKILKAEIATEFQKSIDTDKKKFREVRLSSDLDGINSHIVLYNNKVAFLDYRDEASGVLIENDLFFKSMEVLFEVLWKKSKIF